MLSDTVGGSRCSGLLLPWLPHLPLLVLGEQGAVEVLQREFGHGDSLTCMVAHREGRCHASRHGHAGL